MTQLSPKTLNKLDHPPSGPNWVRFMRPDVDRTAKEIVRFAVGQPPFAYVPAYRAIKDRLELRIAQDTALQIASSRGAPAGRSANIDLVRAFFAYDEVRRFSATNPVDFEREYFRASRDVLIPISPLSVIREKGKFLPIFVVGWKTNPLTLMQRRLLMTMYEDAFLSLTDYQDSPAEILFFPESNLNGGAKKARQPEIWERGDYKILSASELREAVEVFLLAREKARLVLTQMIADHVRREDESISTPPPRPPDLFDPK